MGMKQIKESLMKVPVKYWLAILFGVLYVIFLWLFLSTEIGRTLLMIFGFMLPLVGGGIVLFNLWERISRKLEDRNSAEKIEEKKENDDGNTGRKL